MKLHKVDNWTLTATVGDLVAELLKLNQGAFVFTEGCDCIGNVIGVRLEADGTVLVERDDGAIRNGVIDKKYIGCVD